MMTTKAPTQAKATNTLQSIKLLVMVNSLLVLMAVFLVFFTDGLATETTSTSSVVATNSAIVSDITPMAMTTTAVKPPQATDELSGLPYVSRDGLQQQAAAQVIRVTNQPRVQARSSR